MTTPEPTELRFRYRPGGNRWADGDGEGSWRIERTSQTARNSPKENGPGRRRPALPGRSATILSPPPGPGPLVGRYRGVLAVTVILTILHFPFPGVRWVPPDAGASVAGAGLLGALCA
jgi:hypothetical protein